MSDAQDQVGQVAVLIETGMALTPVGDPARRLGEVALKGLAQLERIIDLELKEDDPKQMRLVGDMALGVCKLFQRASESAFKSQQSGALLELLQALKTEKEAQSTTPGPLVDGDKG